MNGAVRWLSVALLLVGGGVSRAQGPGPQKFMGPPAFLDQLFVPEVIMRYQDDIALTNEQREAITAAMADAQKQLVDLQWQYESASKKLTDTLGAPSIDETTALAEADRVMNLELQMKKTHLALLIRIKKILTPSQQSKLRELHAKEPPHFGPPPPPH
jgi:Spy/CpxP family protein refolding chaperone